MGSAKWLRWALGFGVLILSGACLSVNDSGGEEPLQVELARFHSVVQDRLDSLAVAVDRVAAAALESGVRSPRIRGLLADLCADYPHVIDAFTLGTSTSMAVVAENGITLEMGREVPCPEIAKQVRETKEPALSQCTLTPKAYLAAYLLHPVLSPEGAFVGAVGIVIDVPELIRGYLVTGIARGTSEYEVTQADGLILYDVDAGEINRNLITDPLYAEHTALIELVKRMRAEPSGVGSYAFLSAGLGVVVKKKCHWKTATLHGTEWRVWVMRRAKSEWGQYF